VTNTVYPYSNFDRRNAGHNTKHLTEKICEHVQRTHALISVIVKQCCWNSLTSDFRAEFG